MELLLDPNLSYLLLISGIILLVLSLLSPGTGLLEIGALFTLVLSGIGIYNLPVNFWGLGLLLVAIPLFMISLRRKPGWVYILLTVVCMVSGSILLFKGENSTASVDPMLASVTSILATAILWWAGSKSLAAIQRVPDHDLEKLIGMNGKAHSDIQQEGTAYVNGEEWTARSEQFIPEGSIIQVLAREGLVLLVKRVVDESPSGSATQASND